MTPITLAEWKTQNPQVFIQEHPAGALYLCDLLSREAKADLFRLADYVVSSICAGTIWLRSVK